MVRSARFCSPPRRWVVNGAVALGSSNAHVHARTSAPSVECTREYELDKVFL